MTKYVKGAVRSQAWTRCPAHGHLVTPFWGDSEPEKQAIGPEHGDSAPGELALPAPSWPVWQPQGAELGRKAGFSSSVKPAATEQRMRTDTGHADQRGRRVGDKRRCWFAASSLKCRSLYSALQESRHSFRESQTNHYNLWKATLENTLRPLRSQLPAARR